MTTNQHVKLTHFTKLVLLVLVILGTEFGHDWAVYAATAIWLELGLIVKWERKFIERWIER